MKIQIYLPKPTEVERYLMLKQEDRGVSLIVVDNRGAAVPDGHLFYVGERRFKRMGKVSPEFGFDLNEHGQIRLVHEPGAS